MNPVTDAAELLRAIGQVERKGEGYSTNFHATASQVEAWIVAGGLFMEPAESALLILRRDLHFRRLHHVASDASSLSGALATRALALDATTIVTDLVGKQGSVDAIVDAHARNGFKAYTRLIRMQRLSQGACADPRVEPDVVRAGPDDVPRILALMDRQLDPLSEQIPTRDQLNDAVAQGTVLVMSQASELAGLLIHETVGFTTTLRYWHVDARYRDIGVGGRLMRAFLRQCSGSRRILLWTFAQNLDAISKYRHYGFHEDALVDEILVRGLEPATP